ncbi:hypothetical protein MXB_5619 [Myxobolus squamalis]|nr:hypothetical protein MXB_5619 [Myxobolus squamalis]
MQLFRLYEIFQILKLFFTTILVKETIGKYYPILIWCTNEASFLILHASINPVNLIKCLIVMAHDACTQIFILCIYFLIT